MDVPDVRDSQTLALLGLVVAASSLVIESVDRSDSDLGRAYLIPALIAYFGILLALYAFANRWDSAFRIASSAAGFGALLYVFEALHREAAWSELLLAFVYATISALLAAMHVKRKSG